MRNNQPNRKQNNKPPQQRIGTNNSHHRSMLLPTSFHVQKSQTSNVTIFEETMDVSIVVVLATIVWIALSKQKTGPSNTTTFRMTGQETSNSGLSPAVTCPCCHTNLLFHIPSLDDNKPILATSATSLAPLCSTCPLWHTLLVSQ